MPFASGPGHAHEVGGSIGLARHPEHGSDVETLIQRADIAMYAAKAASSGHATFEPSQDHHSPRRLALAAELRGAIERGGAALAFRPKARLRDGVVIGVEALARWDHPTLGAGAPDEFIPIAEQTGLIPLLTVTCCRRHWRSAAIACARVTASTVSVNLSVRVSSTSAFRRRSPGAASNTGISPDC